MPAAPTGAALRWLPVPVAGSAGADGPPANAHWRAAALQGGAGGQAEQAGRQAGGEDTSGVHQPLLAILMSTRGRQCAPRV